MNNLAARTLLDELNAAYAYCIDSDQLEKWPDFFTDPCLYQVIPRENRDEGLPLALIRCDSRGMLQDRIVAHREANIYGPHAYRHVIGVSHILGVENGEVVACSNYAVYRTWLDAAQYGKSELYSVGEYRDRVVISDGRVGRFAERTVVADTSRIDSLLVTPL